GPLRGSATTGSIGKPSNEPTPPSLSADWNPYGPPASPAVPPRPAAEAAAQDEQRLRLHRRAGPDPRNRVRLLLARAWRPGQQPGAAVRTRAAEPVRTRTAEPARRRTAEPTSRPTRQTTRKPCRTQPPVESGVHPGAFCGHEGALGRTVKGTLMRCSSNPGDR